MNLESILKKTAKPFVIGGAVTYMFFNILAPVGCAKLEPVVGNPPVINPPTQTDNYTPASEPNETPIVEPAPEIVEPYKLYSPTSTPEEFDNFNSALDKAWEIVKDAYGMEPNDQIIAYISEGKKKYGISLEHQIVGGVERLNTPIPDNGLPYPIRHFDPNQEEVVGLKHELAHRFNESLFPTYHSWFDEGSVMYVSGEVEAAKPTSTVLREDDGSLKDYNWMDAIDLLIVNPKKFWDRLDFGGVPGHLIGQVFYLLLEREGLTPEKNREALNILAGTYKTTGTQPTRMVIQSAYEDALDKNLDPLFELLSPGVKILYTHNEKIRSEF